MTGIDVLASFGIDIAKLDAYGGSIPAEAGPPSGSGRPRPIPRARRAARSGAAPRTARPNPAASVPRPGSAAPASTPLGSGSSAIPFPRASTTRRRR